MKMQTYSDVRDALSDTTGEAENMKIHSDLVMAISDHLKKIRWYPSSESEEVGHYAAPLERSIERPYQQIQPRCAGHNRRQCRSKDFCPYPSGLKPFPASWVRS